MSKTTDGNSKLSTTVRTLVAGGFQLNKTNRKPGYIALYCSRLDEFDIEHQYVFAQTERDLTAAELSGLSKAAQNNGANGVIIASHPKNHQSSVLKSITMKSFASKLGGEVRSFLPLNKSYKKELCQLSLNQCPSGLTGRADDIFEEYVKQGLQFLTQERVVRYGQDRRGEVVPDGLILPRSKTVYMYDCKAAKDGYDISTTTLRQFADYVDNFHERYEAYIGRVHSFLVFSSSFDDDRKLTERADQFYEKCQVRLACVTASELGLIVQMLAQQPYYRTSIGWRGIFSKTVVKAEHVADRLQARIKDKVIQK
jgi:hypothetical protein